MNDLLTVDQFAQMLDMHPRTIRRYIRENRLKAAKVGGEWRIRKEDAEMFMGSNAEAFKTNAMEDVQAFMDGYEGAAQGKLQVCTVLDCYVDNAEAMKISQAVMQLMNQPDPARGAAKFQYFFDDQERKGRYIIWGTPAFVGKVLSEVSEAAATN